MGKQFDKISSPLQDFIRQQKMFFVATAAPEGRVNVSPKGLNQLHVIDANRVVWLNLTGSGNETAAHLLVSNRITLMFCSFDTNPLILRLYGQATAYHEQTPEYDRHIGEFPDDIGARQIVMMDVDLVQTSCGFGVPFMEFKGIRNDLFDWSERKGRDGIRNYWQERNAKSLDGLDTGI